MDEFTVDPFGRIDDLIDRAALGLGIGIDPDEIAATLIASGAPRGEAFLAVAAASIIERDRSGGAS